MLVKTSEAQVTIPALMFDPEFYVFDFALKSGLTKFLIIDELKLDQAPFIDSRFEPIAKGYFSVRSPDLFALEEKHDIERPQPVFIFHHAFVCSTLLARCLNQIDAFFALKEPWILRRLADYKRIRGTQTPAKQWEEMFTTYVRLLAKNYTRGRIPVIKATNVASNLTVDVMRFLPEHKLLYLYSDLRSFLISNLKKPPETQAKMPNLARGFVADEHFQQLYPQFCDIDRLSFLEVCALIWISSLYNFNANANERNCDNVRTLLMDDFLADKKTSLARLAHFFGHEPNEIELDSMVSPEVIETDAKHQETPYSTNTRQIEAAQILSANRSDIDKTLAWINPLVEDLGIMDKLFERRLDLGA